MLASRRSQALVDGIAEARDVLRGVTVSFSRKLAGTNRYDGFPELIARTYRSLEMHEPQPIPLDEIDQIACLVDRFTKPELKL